MIKASGILSSVKELLLQSFSVSHIKRPFGNEYCQQVRQSIIQINLYRMISLCVIIIVFELLTLPYYTLNKSYCTISYYGYINFCSQLFLLLVSVCCGIIGLIINNQKVTDFKKNLRLYLTYYLCISVGCLCYIYSDISRGAVSNTIYYLALIISTIPIFALKEALFFIILDTGGVLGILIYNGKDSLMNNKQLIFILLVSWILMFHLRTFMYRIMYNRYKLEDMNKKLDMQSKIDPLTSLPNRRALDEYVKGKLQNWKANNSKVMILMLDIDNFKNYNDTFSHLDGDDCLNAVAQAIIKKLNEYNGIEYILARTGGEEFISIIENWKTEEEILDICLQLNKAVEDMHLVSGEGSCYQYVTISIGCSVYDPRDVHAQGDNPVSAQFRLADYELYNSKKEGKNRVSFKGKIINKLSEVG
jgi:diguanylate cyclase (GGDEF)-like protein